MKRQLNESALLSDKIKLNDIELLELLNISILPNAVDTKAIQYTFFFHLLFLDNKSKKIKIIERLKRLYSLLEELTKIERVVLKFGVVKGFLSNHYRKELFRYINEPLSLKTISSGRKIISSTKFKEIFYFSYSFIKRAENNLRLPKF
jgi:flagellar biosynthesis protein FlhB